MNYPHPVQEKARHDDVRGLVRVLRLMPVGAVWSLPPWGTVERTSSSHYTVRHDANPHRGGLYHVDELVAAEALIPEVGR